MCVQVTYPPSEAAVRLFSALLYPLVSLVTVALTMNWRGTPLSLGWPHTDTWRRRGRRLGRNQSEGGGGGLDGVWRGVEDAGGVGGDWKWLEGVGSGWRELEVAGLDSLKLSNSW